MIMISKFMCKLVGQNTFKDRARLWQLHRWNLNIISVTWSACVVLTADSHSQWDKASGRELSNLAVLLSGKSYTRLWTRWREFKKMQDILPSKLAQATCRHGESSWSILQNYFSNRNREHYRLQCVLLNFTIRIWLNVFIIISHWYHFAFFFLT